MYNDIDIEQLRQGADWLRKEAKESGPSDPLPTAWTCPLHGRLRWIIRRWFSDLGDKTGPIYVMVQLDCGCELKEKDTQ